MNESGMNEYGKIWYVIYTEFHGEHDKLGQHLYITSLIHNNPICWNEKFKVELKNQK